MKTTTVLSILVSGFGLANTFPLFNGSEEVASPKNSFNITYRPDVMLNTNKTLLNLTYPADITSGVNKTWFNITDFARYKPPTQHKFPYQPKLYDQFIKELGPRIPQYEVALNQPENWVRENPLLENFDCKASSDLALRKFREFCGNPKNLWGDIRCWWEAPSTKKCCKWDPINKRWAMLVEGLSHGRTWDAWTVNPEYRRSRECAWYRPLWPFEDGGYEAQLCSKRCPLKQPGMFVIVISTEDFADFEKQATVSYMIM